MSSAPLPRMPEVSLRAMELRDVPDVVHLHQADLAHGFFVELGERFLTRYYRTFLTSPAAVTLIAEVGGVSAGFLVGSTDAVAHRRHVVSLDRWRLARAGAASLLVRPALTARFVRTRAQRYAQGLRRRSRQPEIDADRPRRVGVLSHIAVREDVRRFGVGSALLAGFVGIAKVHGVEQLRLQTARDNTVAQRFYAGHGWKRQEEVRDPDGEAWALYFLDLR